MKCRYFFRWGCVLIILGILFSIPVTAQSGRQYVKGVVKSSSGRLYTSVWVSVSQNGIEKNKSLTGDDGKYYLSGLDEGVYDITVSNGKYSVYTGQISLPTDARHDILIKR